MTAPTRWYYLAIAHPTSSFSVCAGTACDQGKRLEVGVYGWWALLVVSFAILWR